MFEVHKDEIGSKLSDYNDFVSDGSVRLDYAGVFVKDKDGVVRYNIGKKTKGLPCREDIGFIDWILKNNFTKDTKRVAYKIKKGNLK